MARPDFNDDGTIVLPLSRTKAAKLRTPTVGELRRLMEAHNDIGVKVKDRAHRITEKQKALRSALQDVTDEWSEKVAEADPQDRVDVADAAADVKEDLRHQIAAVEDGYAQWRDRLWLDWIISAVETLADGPLPDDVDADDPDGMPAYLVSPELPAKMLRHWQQVPLDSGAR